MIFTSWVFANEIEVSTYKDLKSALSSEGNDISIKLGSDITLIENTRLENGKNITIDFNGHTLSVGENVKLGFLLVKGTLTLTGKGTLIGSNYGVELYNKGTGYEDAILNVGTDVTVKGNVGIGIMEGNNYDSKNITVNVSGKVEGNDFGVYIGGNIKNTDGNSNINIYDTANISASSEGVGAYLAGYGSTSIYGGTVTGGTAIEIRSGNLTVQNGSLNATGTYNVQANNTGSSTAGIALAISQHTTKLPINVTVNGGTFSGAKSFVETNVQNGDNTENITMNITNGTFNGEVSSDIKTAFISGGVYATDIKEYLTNDLVEYRINDGNYQIVEGSKINDVVNKLTKDDTIAIKASTYSVLVIRTEISGLTIKNDTESIIYVNSQTLESGKTETIKEKVATPTTNYEAGTYYKEVVLKFEDATENTTIYIEVIKNGQREYAGPAKDYTLTSELGNENTYTVEAYATKSGMLVSDHYKETFVIAIPDRATLRQLIKTYETKYTSTELAKYTDLTVKAYTEQLENAKTLVEKEDVSQSELSSASSKLQSAVNGLKKKETTNTNTSSNTSNNNSSKSYDPQDKNHDGVVTCDEVNGEGWIWSESSKKCVYKVVNTSTKKS